MVLALPECGAKEDRMIGGKRRESNEFEFDSLTLESRSCTVDDTSRSIHSSAFKTAGRLVGADCCQRTKWCDATVAQGDENVLVSICNSMQKTVV